MSNMRLIIFVKIPGQLKPIPLDIKDSRSTNLVLEDILIITGLSSPDKPAQNYLLTQNGSKLDLNLKLSENGIKNGAVLDLSILTEQSQSTKPQIKVFQEKQHDSEDTPKRIKKTQNNNDKQSVIGKKIDFD